jgi:hypothetical protein
MVWYLVALLMLAGCNGQPQSVERQGTPYVVRCTEPLPEFSLGVDSHPSPAEQEALCRCIWEALGSWERRVAKQLAQGQTSEISAMHRQAFPSRFGTAVRGCGGMQL